jgi:hypothetical protein
MAVAIAMLVPNKVVQAKSIIVRRDREQETVRQVRKRPEPRRSPQIYTF